MDAPNPLAMEGRDVVTHPQVAPPWPPARTDESAAEPRGNADRDKFEQPAAAATAAAGELSVCVHIAISNRQHGFTVEVRYFR